MRHLRADATDTSGIAAVAADALEEIHCAVYGRPPEAARAWTEGDGILLVMRTPPPGDGEAPPVSAMQSMIAAAVLRRTGVTLRPGGVNVDARRGLAVLAFERVRAPDADGPADAVPAGPVRGAGS